MASPLASQSLHRSVLIAAKQRFTAKYFIKIFRKKICSFQLLKKPAHARFIPVQAICDIEMTFA